MANFAQDEDAKTDIFKFIETSDEVQSFELYDINRKPCHKFEFSELYQSVKNVDTSNWKTETCIVEPLPNSCDRKKKSITCKRVYPRNYKYLCKECSFNTFLKGDLTRHITEMHGYKCQMCESVLTSRHKLGLHIFTVHDKIKLHECPFCEKMFHTSQNSLRHQKIIHFGVKEHTCQYCGYQSASLQNAKLHIQRNHEKKPEYKCNLCIFQTHTKPNLLRHNKRIHAKRVEYRCNICFFSCKSSKYLEKHKTTKFHQRNMRDYSYICSQVKD